MMLLRSSSTPALNSLIGIQPKSESNSLGSVRFTQFLVAGNSDGKWGHHDLQPCFGRTLSEAYLHNLLLSNGSPSKHGLRTGSGSLELCRKLSTESFMSSDLRDEALEEELEVSDTEISIGFQSVGDPYEESPEKIMAAIGIHVGEGRTVSGRRICESGGVALVCDRAVVGSKTETNSVNGGFGGEGGGGFSGGTGYGRRGGGFGSNSNKTETNSVNGGFGGEGGGGFSGGTGYGGRGGGFGSDSNNTDEYYKKMLQADPGNPLLLTNYGRFLQEVQHDLERAEEYYGRAILASPSDGDILSLYANIIWDVYRDAPRAKSYFDQAVEAAPEDCNVLRSYAHFLWNAEDDEEDQGASQQQKIVPPTYFGTATTAVT